jgi:hypothetical protein
MAAHEELFWAAWPLVLAWRSEHARLSKIWSRGERFRHQKLLGKLVVEWREQTKPWIFPLYRPLPLHWDFAPALGWELQLRTAEEARLLSRLELLVLPGHLLTWAYAWAADEQIMRAQL